MIQSPLFPLQSTVGRHEDGKTASILRHVKPPREAGTRVVNAERTPGLWAASVGTSHTPPSPPFLQSFRYVVLLDDFRLHPHRHLQPSIPKNLSPAPRVPILGTIITTPDHRNLNPECLPPLSPHRPVFTNPDSLLPLQYHCCPSGLSPHSPVGHFDGLQPPHPQPHTPS